jgi:hypothetical protein
MRIEFTVIDDDGNRYRGGAELTTPCTDVVACIPAEALEQSDRKDSKGNGLPTHILRLRGEGFFADPRTSSEVHEKLQETYHCLPDRVQMALLRLQRRRELRKALKKIGDEEKVAYVW